MKIKREEEEEEKAESKDRVKRLTRCTLKESLLNRLFANSIAAAR